MRTSAYVAPASFAALSASATRSSASGSPGIRGATKTRRGAASAAAAAAPVLRKSRRFVGMWGEAGMREATAHSHRRQSTRRHHRVRLAKWNGAHREAERSRLVKLPSRANELAKPGSIQRGSDADAAYTERRGISNRQRRPGKRQQEVHGFAERRANGSNVFRTRDSWRIERIGTRCLECLQSTQRVVEIGAAMQVVLGATDEHERKRKPACRFRGRRHAFDGMLKIVDR